MNNVIKSLVGTLVLSLTIASAPVLSYEEADHKIIDKIRAEGFNNSQVMGILTHLTDNIGPRLTGSPSMKKANEWTAKTLSEWGLKNSRLEAFEFGPGWTANSSSMHLVSPTKSQLYALPLSWHPGTNGELSGDVFYAPMSNKADLEKYKGMLKGKIVLVDKVRPLQPKESERKRHYTEEHLTKLQDYRVPQGNGASNNMWWVNYVTFNYEREQFLAREGALAMVRISSKDDMVLRATSYQFKEGYLPKVPGMQLASHHYNRLVRMKKDNQDVKLSLNYDVTYHREDLKSYSTLADIPGKGKDPEIVLAGAHLDSWQNGTGATDNGSGVAVVMEAIRILKAIDFQPKRTIRIGLWGGEEQGLFGSHQYVMDYLADRPVETDEKFKYMSPYDKQNGQFPITPKKGFEKFAAYFNLDRGAGQIRGIYAENNSKAAALFKKWLKPFHDLGAKTVTMNGSGGTDHLSFKAIGLPGFQFIQDPLDYRSHTHHTQIDTLDMVHEEDLKKSAVIMAAFLYNAAMANERFPRTPMPKPAKNK